MIISESTKKINLIGILVWTLLYFVLIPSKIIKNYPIIVIGYLYTVFILFMNYKFVGENKDIQNNKEPDFKDVIYINELMNNKAIQVATAIFALSIAIKDIFNKSVTQYMLLFIVYTLLFGVGIIIPLYFISNQKSITITNRINRILIILRNISLSYSIGFMVSGLLIIVNRIYELI